MLSRAEPTLPTGPGWLFEPKYDGFRAVVYRDEVRVDIDSRNGKALAHYFPELTESLRESLPDRCVVDGEIVACNTQGLDFETLSARLGRRREDRHRPTSTAFIAFDILAHGTVDLRRQRFTARRARLERIVRDNPAVVVTPQTDDPAAARFWLTGFEKKGIEGVVAKRADQQYEPGRRRNDQGAASETHRLRDWRIRSGS